MGTIGKKIENPMELLKHKSVYVKQWGRTSAVSFLISMQARALFGFMALGIYEYTPSEKKRKSFTEVLPKKLS